jgi:hypothetical protein
MIKYASVNFANSSSQWEARVCSSDKKEARNIFQILAELKSHLPHLPPELKKYLLFLDEEYRKGLIKPAATLFLCKIYTCMSTTNKFQSIS